MGDDSVTGNILGYDLNEKNCQISFYSEAQQEPQTMELVADNYQIPLVLGRKGDVWLFGNDAKRPDVLKEGHTVSNLLVRSLAKEKFCWMRKLMRQSGFWQNS